MISISRSKLQHTNTGETTSTMTQNEWAMLMGQANRITDSIRDNKRYKEQQILEAAMREREEKWRSEQLALQKAMQARQIKRMDEDSERWRAIFDRDNNRYLDDIINQSVKDKVESDRYAEGAAARHATSQHGQKIDLGKLDLAMMEHELRKQQVNNQPIGTAQYGWGTDEKGNPVFMPMSQTMSIFPNASGGTTGTSNVGTGAGQAVPVAAPNTPASPPTAIQAAAPTGQTSAPDLQPNPEAAHGPGLWARAGQLSDGISSLSKAPLQWLGDTSIGKAVKNQYNEAKKDRAYHRAVQNAQRKPSERNYAQQQAIDFLKMGAEPLVAAGSAMKPAWDASVSTLKEARAANKADRAKHRAAQLEAEERELRRRAERLDALAQAQY